MSAPTMQTHQGGQRTVQIGDLVQSRRTGASWFVRGIYRDDRGSIRLDLWDYFKGWRRGVLAANYRIVERLPLPLPEVAHEAA